LASILVEKREELLGESASKEAELKVLKGKEWSDLWEEDLETLLRALADKVRNLIHGID
jgi:hypothetical protein